MATLIANSTAPPIPPDIAAKTGPRILGYLFHWGLFGALCVQVYLYHLAFPKDPLRNKLFVYSVFVLEVAQTVMITFTAFHVFGYGYGDLDFFNTIGIAWFSVPVITGVVAFIAEAFYAYRISVLARSYWVAGVIIFLAFVQLGGSIAAALILKHARLFSRLLGKDYSIAAGVWNGGSAVCDVIIAVCMTYYLSRRGEGTMQSTNVLLRRVIRLVIETGAITGIVDDVTAALHLIVELIGVVQAAMAILNLILSTLPGQPSYYLVTSETLGKFYSNSMMVVLNSRIRIGIEQSQTSADVTTVGRVRTGVISRSGTDAYELGDGVMITREEIVLSDSDRANKEFSKSNKTYLV